MPRKLPQNEIEKNGDGELVNDCLKQGWTFEKTIAFVKEATGREYTVGQMHRHYHKRFVAAIEKVIEVERLVEAILDREASGSEVNIAAALRRSLLAQALDAVADMDAQRIKEMKPGELALMIARLERTGAATEQLRMKFGKGITAAKEAIVADLEKELQGDPELLARVREKAEAAAARAREDAA